MPTMESKAEGRSGVPCGAPRHGVILADRMLACTLFEGLALMGVADAGVQEARTKYPLRSVGSNRAGADRTRFTGLHGASIC
jgi:hypothetical protein